MKIIKSIKELKKEINFKNNIGFVPTMGSLHKGHISLIKASKKKCNKTLTSIFVNPTQFNKANDYKKYPRDIKKDIRILKKEKVDYLFMPTINEIYKRNIKKKIKILKSDIVLCAKYRKGHFEGVLAVINRLLKNIKAKYMFLGEKDYQQAFLINKFIKNRFKTKIIIKKTIRLKGKVPYSSRNILLSKNQLKKAIFVSSNLYKFKKKLDNNFKNLKNLFEVLKLLKRKGIKVEYFEVRNKFNLTKSINKNNYKLFIAYYLGCVRLIDNI